MYEYYLRDFPVAILRRVLNGNFVMMAFYKRTKFTVLSPLPLIDSDMLSLIKHTYIIHTKGFN